MASISSNTTIKIDPLTEHLRHQKRERILRRLTPFLLTIPYLLGLFWTALHPIVSVITGELKCRGSYIDENGLDVHRHQVDSYPLNRVDILSSSLSGEDAVDIGLCDAIYSGRLPISDTSYQYQQSGYECQATEGQQQTKGWYDASDLNASMLHMIQKLGSSKDAPWLTKIVYIVSPTAVGNAIQKNATVDTATCQQQTNLTTVVDAFITSYLGSGGGGSGDASSKQVNPLPPRYSFPMIRSLLVLSDVIEEQVGQQMTKTGNTKVRILPQGTGGALPNLDLVFATFYSFQTHPSGGRYEQSHSIYYGNSEFRAHPFGTELEKNVKNVVTRLGGMLGLDKPSVASLQTYASDLAGWIGFVAALVIGPVQPHSFALNHGIDALTIEVHVPSMTNSVGTSAIHAHYADLSRCIEHLLRSISNLHERLHHSVAQYTMPSPSKFVSHGEYIYPAILVSLPMVVRAASLALRDITLFQFEFVGIVVGTVLITSCANACTVLATGRSYIGVLMVIVAWVVRHNIPQSSCREKESRTDLDTAIECRKSLRFVTCLAGIYLHVPLLLANYSLGFPSAVFWTPLLAILVLSDRLASFCSNNTVLKAIITVAKMMLLVAISPSTILPSNLSPQYVLILYTPLQLLLTALWFV
eukprot:scaffold947_cov155-Skeletonema_menzelii.AAC.6